MKKWIMAAAVAAALLSGTSVRAQGAPVPGGATGPVVGTYAGYDGAAGMYGSAGLSGPPGYVGTEYGKQGISQHAPGTSKFWARKWFGGPHLSSSQNLTMMPTLPVFMAAPWYNYWPYDGHFQTVAPMAHGLYYPPPLYTGNPYMTGTYPGYVPNNPNPVFPPTGPAGPAPK